MKTKVIGIGDNVCDKYYPAKIMYPGGQAMNFSVYAKMLGADAAYMGVFLHGSAGDAAAARFGMRGMTSVEIIEGLWEVLKRPD